MIKNQFNNPTKSIYLADWETRQIGSGYLISEDVIATHITNKKTAEALSGIELVFENDKLSKAYHLDKDKKTERNLKSEEVGLEYKEFEENRKLELIEDKNGHHQLGGEIPNEFQLPENNCAVPFQYLGYINNQDEIFNWLPFKLHLTFPIYLDIEDNDVYIDYSDAAKPIIFNKEYLEAAGTEYEDDLDQNSEIVYNEMKFSFIYTKKGESFTETVLTGIPAWIQRDDIPLCPKSGKRMRFVCQMNGGVTTKRTNFDIEEKKFCDSYENLNFESCNLYVFFEPTSKMACYFLQGD